MLCSPELAVARERGELLEVGAGYGYVLKHWPAQWARWVCSVLDGQEEDVGPLLRLMLKGFSKTVWGRTALRVTGTVQGLNAVVESEGLVVRVTEGELEAARLAIGETEGIWVDLAGAAGIAAVQKLASRGDVPARVQAVAVVTEHGLLDDSSIAHGQLDVVDARVDDLLRVLAVRGE